MIPQEVLPLARPSTETQGIARQRTSRAVELRPMDEGDFQQVLNLYGIVFGQTGLNNFSNRWQWAQRDNLFPEETYRWVLADQGRIVGFLAAFPLPYSINGETVVAHTPCDYMVHPDYRFHGLKLMRQFFASCPNCVTCDDIPATIKVTQWLGASLVGPLTGYSKILDGHIFKVAKLPQLPDIFYSFATQALRLLDSLLLVGASAVKVERIDRFDERFDRFFQECSKQVRATVTKDHRFLNWRYGQGSPQNENEIVAATDDTGELVGYAVLYVDNSPRVQGYILDLLVLPCANQKVARALMAYAVRRFRQRGARVVRYFNASPRSGPSPGLLRWLGFTAILGKGRVLMVKLADPRLAAVAGEASNWWYGYGDTEMSHALT